MNPVSDMEAVQRINEYIEGSSTSPFFVIVDGSELYNSILNSLVSLKKVRMSDYCDGDAFPDYDEVYDVLSKGNENRILVGLGDSVFLSGYNRIIGRIRDIRIRGKLVVLCRGIRAHILKLNEIDKKFNSRRYCEVKSSLDYSVICVNPSVDFCAEEDFKAMLHALEDGKYGDVYVHTELPISCARRISSSYEAIREKSAELHFAEKMLLMEFWDEYNRDSILDDYDLLHWRTFLKMQFKQIKNDYLRIVVNSSDSYESYKNRLYDALMDIPKSCKDYWHLYGLRKTLLKDLPEIQISRYVSMTLQKDDERIYYLTDNTATERYAIIEEISRWRNIPKEIKTIYPALEKYLMDYMFRCKNEEIFIPYFAAYKRQKLNNAVSVDFLEKVIELAKDGNRKYTALDTRGTLVEKLDNGKNKLCWVDALGVEYLGYIQTVAKEMGLSLVIQVGRAALPTLTCYNKDFYDSWKGGKVQTKELDELKHGGKKSFSYENQKMPIHLAEELRIIDDALNWAKSELLQNNTDTVVIASDHGASRLAVINNKENKWKMATDGEHSGRCCPTNEIDNKPDTATDERGFWVLANYDRFQGGRKASVEVHGGASLEEVLVPVIQISLASGTVELKNLTETAYSSWDEDPSIEIFSPAHIEALAIRFQGRLYHSVPIGERKHKVTFDGFKKSGDYTADVLDGDDLIGEINFKIDKRSGGTKSSEEDDFFK